MHTVKKSIKQKNIINSIKWSIFQPEILLLVLLMISLMSCSEDEVEQQQPNATSDEVMTIPFFIEDADGNLSTDPATPLFESRGHQPVIAPDGHQITLGEFSTVQGNVSVTCVEGGSRVTMELSGLIPDGVYTIWNATFKAPGADPTVEDLNMIGLGALGSVDGSESTFTASADGKATITAVTPGGPLSMFGSIAACPLSDEIEWHVVGAYHIDGNTHGPDLGPDGTAVEQFGFAFKQETPGQGGDY